MKQLEGEQLSLIAESDFLECLRPGDWDEDVPLRDRSIDEVRVYFARLAGGGQTKNSSIDVSVGGNGGQPATTSDNDGGQNKNSSIFDRNEGDDGTWIEIQHRKGGSYRKLRWRDGKIKRGKYLGVA